jgi:ADP-ribose pyrophosphatase
MHPWKTLSRSTVFTSQDPKYLTVESHRIELPDGRQLDAWPWLITPDFVNVVILTTEGNFVCFRQTKYAVEGVSLAVAGGYLEAGEEPLDGARREVLEETGYAAPEWISLGTYAVDGNRGCGRAHLFLARDARPVKAIDADDLEEQEMLILTRQEIEAALHDGAFKVLPWSTAVALALLRLDRP